MNANGKNDTYLPTIKAGLEQILAELDTLLKRRAALQARITTLEADGCIHGNVVTEYRGGNGPYYRLTFYTDPTTGVKPSPKYLGVDGLKVTRVRQQIANHQERAGLQENILEINKALEYVENQVAVVRRYLTYQNRPRPQQLVIPATSAGNNDSTKTGGDDE